MHAHGTGHLLTADVAPFDSREALSIQDTTLALHALCQGGLSCHTVALDTVDDRDLDL